MIEGGWEQNLAPRKDLSLKRARRYYTGRHESRENTTAGYNLPGRHRTRRTRALHDWLGDSQVASRLPTILWGLRHDLYFCKLCGFVLSREGDENTVKGLIKASQNSIRTGVQRTTGSYKLSFKTDVVQLMFSDNASDDALGDVCPLKGLIPRTRYEGSDINGRLASGRCPVFDHLMTAFGRSGTYTGSPTKAFRDIIHRPMIYATAAIRRRTSVFATITTRAYSLLDRRSRGRFSETVPLSGASERFQLF